MYAGSVTGVFHANSENDRFLSRLGGIQPASDSPGCIARETLYRPVPRPRVSTDFRPSSQFSCSADSACNTVLHPTVSARSRWQTQTRGSKVLCEYRGG